MRHHELSLLLLSSLLVACGGGGSGGSANRAPTVDIIAPVEAAVELTNVSLAATASDPDGDSLSYSWEQTGGIAVTINAASNAEMNFDLPELDGPGTISFRVTVDDGHQHTASATVELAIRQQQHAVIAAAIDYPNSYEVFRVGDGDPLPVRLATPRADAAAGNPVTRNLGNPTSGRQLSPDGSRVMWSDAVAAGEPRVLHIADVFGGAAPTVLSAQPGASFASWSPDSSMIAFVRTVPGFGRGLFVVGADSVDGSDARRISGDVNTWSDYAWSPDSATMAFRATDNRIRLVPSDSIDGSDHRIITAVPAIHYSWSPDGEWIYFLDSYAGGYLDLNKVRSSTLDGSDKITLLDKTELLIGNYQQNFPAVSPDGSRLIVGAVNVGGTSRGLFSLAVDGSDLRQLSPASANSLALQDYAWSPDGSMIAMLGWFETDQKKELYVVDSSATDGTQARKVSGSDIDSIGRFAWAPDGQSLVFSAAFVSAADSTRIFASSASGDGSDRREISGAVQDTDGDGIPDSDFGYFEISEDSRFVWFLGDLEGDGLEDVFRVPLASAAGAERQSATGYGAGEIDVSLMIVTPPGR